MCMIDMAGWTLLMTCGLAQRGDEDIWRNNQVSGGQQGNATSTTLRSSSHSKVPTAAGKSDLYNNVEVAR